MRFFAILFLVFSTSNIYSNNIWITQRAREFTTASGMFIHVGTRTRGYAVGSEQVSQGTAPYCFVMLDGMNWNPCSPALTGGMKVTSPVRILPDGRMVGVIQELQGWSVLSSFIHSEDMMNFIPVYFFDQNNKDDSVNGNPRSLEVIGNNVWLGTKNGKIKTSRDLGYTWENIVLSTDTAMEISVVVFTDEMNGLAGGGVITTSGFGNEETSTVEKKGTIWRTTDGGNSWSAVVQNLDAYPLHLIQTASGRMFMLFHDNKSINEQSGSKKVAWSDDQFATFSGSGSNFDIPVPSGKFSMESAIDMDGGAVNEIWVAGFCGAGFSAQPCTVDTSDGGDTWWEKIVPGAVKLGAMSVLDSNHVYIAGEFKAMYKWGDPNEDFTEPDVPDVPDEDDPVETPDNDTGNGQDDQPDKENDTNPDEDSSDEEIEYFDEEGCSCSFIK
jgi:hypothetical protein